MLCKKVSKKKKQKICKFYFFALQKKATLLLQSKAKGTNHWPPHFVGRKTKLFCSPSFSLLLFCFAKKRQSLLLTPLGEEEKMEDSPKGVRRRLLPQSLVPPSIYDGEGWGEITIKDCGEEADSPFPSFGWLFFAFFFCLFCSGLYPLLCFVKAKWLFFAKQKNKTCIFFAFFFAYFFAFFAKQKSKQKRQKISQPFFAFFAYFFALQKRQKSKQKRPH